MGLPDTSQTRCYDQDANAIECTNQAWPGQDAFYATGCPSEGRFNDNGDGTVTDTCTGLMWQQETADIDRDGKITPQLPLDAGPDGVTWQQALQYCEELEFAGYDDWRLPNVRELQSIVDYDRRFPHPAIDHVFKAEDRNYWTSTSNSLPNEALLVTFYACSELWSGSKELRTFVRAARSACAMKNGDVNADKAVDISDAITILGHLFLGNPVHLPPLCQIRSGLPDTGQTTCYDTDGNVIDCESESWPGQDAFYATGCPSEGRFNDNGDGTVTDTCTGLMWQQRTADVNGDGEVTASPTDLYGLDGITWQQALKYCEALEFAGYDDWRLPNARELESIVNYSGREPCIDSAFEAESLRYWTSSNLEPAGEVGDNPTAAGFVAFSHSGRVYHATKTRACLLRAVRNMR